MTVWLDGKLVPDDGVVPADDRGLLLGDGVFDTQQAQDGKPLFFQRHMGRLRTAAQVLGLRVPFDDRQIYEACREVAVANGLDGGRASLRLTLSRGSGPPGLMPPSEPAPRLLIGAHRAQPPERPAVVTFAHTRRNEGSPASRLKTLSYIDNLLARQEALAVGADEAIMLNNAGRPACASVANILAVLGNTVMTPPLSEGVLDGIVRGVLMEMAPRHGLTVQEATLTVDAIAGADALVLTNALNGVRPVSHLVAPATDYAPDHEGVAALQRAYGEAVARDIALG